MERMKEMTMKELTTLLNSPDPAPKPDGVFFSEATEEEYHEYLHKEVHGWKGFIKRVLDL
jgi:hypothetical protein